MTITHPVERRQHMRIALPFPATVAGVSDKGGPFECSTVIDDLSAGGLYLRVADQARAGSEVSVKARLSMAADRGMVVLLKGRVLRVEPKPGGAYGVAVRIEKHQIL